jgi:hypothetical protein
LACSATEYLRTFLISALRIQTLIRLKIEMESTGMVQRTRKRVRCTVGHYTSQNMQCP